VMSIPSFPTILITSPVRMLLPDMSFCDMRMFLCVPGR
jgi:hypothetical protein